MDFGEFMQLHKKFPQMLHPAFRVQDKMAEKTLGRNWWIDRKNMFADERAAKMKGDAAEKERATKHAEKQQKQQVMRKMGVVQYYLNCSRRKKYLARVRAIDDDDDEREQSKREKEEKKAAELARIASEREARNRSARGGGANPGETAKTQSLDLYGESSSPSPKKHKKEKKKKKEKLKEKKKDKKKKRKKDRWDHRGAELICLLLSLQINLEN